MKFGKVLTRRINNAILEDNPKGFDDFWGYSIYDKNLLRALYSTVNKAATYRYIYLSIEDLQVIAEDIIPHVMTMEFADTLYCKAGNEKPTSAVGFLKMLFYECRKWSYIMPRNDSAKERDFVLGRQYRSGKGHQTSMSPENLEWLEQSEEKLNLLWANAPDSISLLDDISRVKDMLSSDETIALDAILSEETNTKLSRRELMRLLKIGKAKAKRIQRNIESATMDCMDVTV